MFKNTLIRDRAIREFERRCEVLQKEYDEGIVDIKEKLDTSIKLAHETYHANAESLVQRIIKKVLSNDDL